MSKIKIGLFGFGVVGEGLCQVLEKVGTTNAEIKKYVSGTFTKKDRFRHPALQTGQTTFSPIRKST